MKTKRSTLIGLLSTLLVIVTVLSSVLVFTAMADSTEPETSPDIYKYASSVAELKEKNELTDWYLDEDGWDVWYEVDPATNGRDTGYYFIDLTELDYDTVAFALASQKKNIVRYAFLTEMPENDGDLPKYAEGTGYNKMETSNSSWEKKLAGRLFFDDIPEDAKYLAVLGRYWGSDGYCPTSITFLRTDKNLLRNDLATYEYQINDILCASHTVGSSAWETKDAGKVTGSGLIPIAGTTFDSVSFTPSFVGDTVEYNFLTGIPGNWDKMSGFTVDGSVMKTAAAGEKIEIPAGAKYIVVRHTTQNTLKLPARITFFNSNGWLGIPAASTTKTIAYTGLEEDGCVYGWNSDDRSHKWLETYLNKDEVQYFSGFIDLTDRDYTKVTFVSSGTYLGYAFLNEAPVLGEKVSYAGGATKFTEPGPKAGETVEVNIPADATTIVVWMREGETSYVPSSISLTYEEKAAVPYGIELGAVAEARLNANSGLRFTTRIPTAELADLDDYTVGTLIFPTDALDGALTVDTEGALNIEMTNGVAGNEYTYFTAAMTNIIAQNYAREFTAVSYIKVDGEYYYTAATSSSIYEAAVETYKANAEDPNADAVRAYIDGVVVIEGGKQVMPYDGYKHPLSVTYVVNEPTATLTITGENLTEDSLKAVIINGNIYTGGWTFDGDKFVATFSFLRDDSLSEYNYPMNTITPADGCVMLEGENKDVYMVDPENPDHKVAFIYIEGTVFTGAKFTGNEYKWMGWYWLDELPELGETIDYAGGMVNIHESSRGSGSQSGKVSIEPGAKWLCVWYQKDADGTSGDAVNKCLPEGILFVK